MMLRDNFNVILAIHYLCDHVFVSGVEQQRHAEPTDKEVETSGLMMSIAVVLNRLFLHVLTKRAGITIAVMKKMQVSSVHDDDAYDDDEDDDDDDDGNILA